MTLDTSGNLTLGLAGTQQGGLVLANTSAFTTTIRSSNSSAESYTLTLPTTNGSPNEVLQTDGAGATSWVAQTGGANFWQINEGALSPFSLTADFNLGATATSSAKLSIAGSLDRGKAAMILNQTENQDIFTASSAGVQRFRLDNTGNLFVYDTTGADYLSLGHDGTDANILTNAGNINIGSGGGDLILGVNTTTPVGILFTESDQIYATGGETITISDLANVTPDATDQYDLGSDTLIWNQVFTNQICFDGSSDCMTSSAVGKWQENLGALSPYSLTADLLLGSTASSSARIDLAGSLTRGRAAAIINQTENQDIFTASAGGTPRFTIDTNGYVKIGTQTVLSTRGGTGNFFAGTDAPSAGSNDQYNTALGINALDSLNNSTGIHNTALGYSALTALTSGDYNTAIGSTALGSLNGGSKNTVIGYNALNLSTGASQNTVMGNSAAYRMGSSGSDNLILGYQAAYGVDTNYTNSNNNVFLGSQTAYNITSNSLGNVMMGHQSGYNMEAGADYNVFLGYNSGYYELGSNKLVIENTNSLTPLVFGDFNLDYFGVNGMLGVGNATPSSFLHVNNLGRTASGQALSIFNQTESNDIISASSSGTRVFTLSNTGDVTLFSNAGATADLFKIAPPSDTGTQYTGTLSSLNLTNNRAWNLPDNGGTIALTSDISGSTNFWQSNDGALTPYSTTLDLNLGATATSSAKISLAGSLTRGKALGIFNQTEQQDILAASAAGANVWRLGYDGSIVKTSASTGLGYSLVGNSLSTGSLLSISSTSTALSSGNLALLDWSPSNWATASGDLFKINIGQYGDITGNMFAVYDNTSELFSIDTTKITSAIPHEFLGVGDVTMAYDLNFSNQTSGNILSSGSLSIKAGDSWESNNLTLATYNGGDIVLDPGNFGTVSVGTGSAILKFHVQDRQAATASAIIENLDEGTGSNGLLIKLGAKSNMGTGNAFIKFLNGDGLAIGKITGQTSTTINYNSNGVDFAEYFSKDASTFVPGEVVSLGPDGATRTSSLYDSKMIGVVSTAPGFSGGISGPDKVLVGIVGQVPILIDPGSPAIQPGDLLTGSTVTGRARKATQPGYTIGKALQGWAPGGPDSILAYINNVWADPNNSLAFDESGNLSLSGSLTATDVVAQTSLTDLDLKLSAINDQLLTINAAVASASAELASLQSQFSSLSAPAATLSAQFNELTLLGDATISGQLSVSGPTLLADTTIAGTLSVGLLKFDDMASDISSLTGLLSFNNGVTTIDEFGNITTTGEVTAVKYNVDTSDVLGSSVGKAVLPTGTQELVIETTAVTPASNIFLTPDQPVAVAASATESGRFTIRIPTALIEDLSVNWWVIN